MALTGEDWRRAVAAELTAETRPYWGPVAEARRISDDLVRIVFHRDRLRRGQDAGSKVRLDDGLAGADVVHASKEGSEWAGEVVLVDEDEDLLLVRSKRGRTPAPRDGFQIFPTAWHKALDNWLRAHGPTGELEPALRARFRGPVASPSPLRPPDELRKAQREALDLARRPLAVLWGPPGTGKTFTLARLVADRVAAGEKVLVLAPTRVAADAAALAVDAAFQAAGRPRWRGDVLRTDLPELQDAFERDGGRLLVWQEEDAAYRRALSGSRRELEGLRARRAGASDARLRREAELLAALDEVRAAWRMRQEELVANALVVCATVRQEQGRGWCGLFPWVVVDEAGMVSLADALALLWRTDARTLWVGDHRQLGPISQVSDRFGDGEEGTDDAVAREWIGTSLLERLFERHRGEVPWVMLEEQSRMNPELCELVSRTAYEGRLRPVDAPPPGVPPRLPGGICVLDSDEPPAWLGALPDLGRVRDWRHATPSSAACAVALARRLADEGHSVVLSSPYRAQAQLLRRGVGDRPDRIRAGTVHRLQGQEADVSIHDPAKPHRWFPRQSPDAPRLLNVAASRGRRCFVLCNGLTWLKKNELLRPWLAAARTLR